MKAAIYHLNLPIDTPEQTAEALNKLRQYAMTKGYSATEHIDRMFYGKESRPAFTNLQKDVKAGKYQAVICLSLARWAVDLKQLISSLSEIQARGMEFIALQDAVDMNFVRIINNFLKSLRTTKIKVSMAQARAIGIAIGRKPTAPEQVAKVIEVYQQYEGLSVRDIGKKVGLPKSTVFRILSEHRGQRMPEQAA